MARVAIIGAGAAGLTTAYGLRGVPVEIVVFEKSRGYGGRLATRGRRGCRYDHGAPSFSASSERVRRLVTAHLPTDQLVEIGNGDWRFDGEGTLLRPRPGEEVSSGWNYYSGISHLAKLLARFSRADVQRGTRIERLHRRGNGWTLRTQEGGIHSGFDAVVLTPPAPQSAALLAQSELTGEQVRRIRHAVEGIEYTSQFSYVFGYDRAMPRPGSFHALTSADDAHPIARLGYEHDKPGHVPEGRSVVVVQTSPSWTRERLEQDPETFVPEVKEAAGDLLVTDLRHPSWYDVQRWRYARPRSGVDDDVLSAAAEMRLFLAGDYVPGVGRVEQAIESGFDAAQRLRDTLLK